ncbi:unnamed protein product [Caenorhabditis sp. 36 PRJEB53466]|nr:unnamed protein product [Caenorhabditis sp. 36 PRJEB53466]
MRLHRLRLPIITIAMAFTMLLHGGFSQHLPPGQRHVKETFLAGSEFEESLIAHLLNSSAMVTLNDDISTLLSSTNLTYTLSSPDKPFEFVDRHYFWSKEKFVEFADSDNTSVFSYVCVYNVSNDDGIFSQIYFPDGNPITEVVFGCENNKECCGMKCCGDDVLINIIIVGAISLALLFLLLCNILIGFKKRREKDRRDATATYQATETTSPNDLDAQMVSADQITYDTRHPSAARGINAHMIESLPNEHASKKI